MNPNIKQTLTRRLLMLGIATSGFAMPAMSDEPTASVATKQRLMKSLTPIASRTIRLKPITAKLPRAVVTAIASDPRGEVIAVAGDDHAIRILDSATMRVLQTLRGHRDLIRTLAYDQSGEKLVSAGNDGQLIVWDRDGNYSVMQRMQGTPALTCVCFAPDGNEMAAVGFDSTVFMIGQTRRDKSRFRCDCKDLRAVAYRDDNELIAVAGRSGELHLFAPESGELIFEAPLHSGRVHDLEFHRDANTLVSVGEDGTAVVFDTRNLRVVRRVPVSTGKLFAVSVINSSHVAVAGSDNLIRVVNTDVGKVVRSLKGHSGSIPTLAFIGGNLFSGGYDATLRRWSLDSHLGDTERIAEGEHAIDR